MVTYVKVCNVYNIKRNITFVKAEHKQWISSSVSISIIAPLMQLRNFLKFSTSS